MKSVTKPINDSFIGLQFLKFIAIYAIRSSVTRIQFDQPTREATGESIKKLKNRIHHFMKLETILIALRKTHHPGINSHREEKVLLPAAFILSETTRFRIENAFKENAICVCELHNRHTVLRSSSI